MATNGCRVIGSSWASRLFRVAMALAALALVEPGVARGDDLVKEALSSFPPQTIRLEYSDVAKLRELPDYSRLRQRYLAKNLRDLETSLGKLGIAETDINELALGWQSGPSGLVVEGLAAGNFNAASAARKAAAAGIKPAVTAGLAAYCFGDEANSPCVMILSPTLGAFGSNPALRLLARTRGGEAASLNSDANFVGLVTEGRRDTPIWGVATGPAVTDWFKSSMPSQKNLQLDWQSQLQSVRSLDYSIKAKDQVELNVEMDCASPQAAGSLRQVLDGLRLFQQVAWQQQNPGLPNPFQSLAVDTSGQQVLLTLNTPYSALEAGVGNP